MHQGHQAPGAILQRARHGNHALLDLGFEIGDAILPIRRPLGVEHVLGVVQEQRLDVGDVAQQELVGGDLSQRHLPLGDQIGEAPGEFLEGGRVAR